MIAIASGMKTGVLILILFVLPLLGAETVSRGAYFVPGDPKAGMRVFLDKGCARCHAILGEGGRTAPDLARAPAGHLSAAEAVAAMWNHAPAMWNKMRTERVSLPRFSDPEMTNLFAFLYSVRSLDEPGDPERGRRLLSDKRCLECHAVSSAGRGAGPDLRTWTSHRNPVSWIQSMWNHGLAMRSLMAARGLSWPEFKDNDMADIIAYIRTLAGVPKTRANPRLANAEAGARVFEQKGCATCHSFRGAGGKGGPDLGIRPLPRTLGQFATLMWNHAPAMWSSMQARKMAPPQFSNQEMADLIAHLFTQRYFEASGSADRGRRIFEEKGCGSCHSPSGGTPRGPSLAAWRGAASPVRLAAALWNHGPLMLGTMERRQIPWPRFLPAEVADLMEFLSAGQRPPQRAGVKQ